MFIYVIIKVFKSKKMILKGSFIMTVWSMIYNRYCEGDLEIKKHLHSVFNDMRLRRLENEIGVCGGKAHEKLENEVANMCIDAERRGFYAAVKIMLRLISE